MSTNTIPKPSPPPKQTGWSPVEMRVFDLTNQARAAAHLPPLQTEDGLRRAAVEHSTDMLDRHFSNHVNPSGEGPADRISRIDRQLVGTVGENIWDGSGDFYASNPDLGAAVVDAWMHSPGHRANILSKEYTHLGVGVVIRDQEVRATQDFARARAFLNEPLPERVRSGTAVNLSTHGEPPAAEMFDLEPLNGARNVSAHNPMPVAGARLTAAPGRYRVRLYFRTSQTEFEIFGGPSVLIG